MFFKYDDKGQKLTSESFGLLNLNFVSCKFDYKGIVNLTKSWYSMNINIQYFKIKRYRSYILYKNKKIEL